MSHAHNTAQAHRHTGTHRHTQAHRHSIEGSNRVPRCLTMLLNVSPMGSSTFRMSVVMLYGMLATTALYRRKLKLKAKLESDSSHFSFKC